MTDINWLTLSTVEQLKQLDEESREAPVIIFKHSTRCSISSAALNRLERKWLPGKTQDSRNYFLDLIQYREVSTAVADHYGIQHQSPQILVIRDGKAIYDSSHFGISFGDLVTNIEQIST